MVVPSIRLYEDIVCHHYYNGLEGDKHRGFDDKIEEKLCKVKEVQQELNILFAGVHFLGAFMCKFLQGMNKYSLANTSSIINCCPLWTIGGQVSKFE